MADAPLPGGEHDSDLPAPRQVPAPTDWTPPSWDEVVREHSGRVYRLAYRLTGNVHDAEDLTQDVFVRVFRSLSSYTPGTFEGWLHRITTNLFLDGVRRKQRIRFDALADDAAERVSGREPPPDRAVDERMLDGDIQAALDELPPDFGLPSCCATSRACRTRRSPQPSASSWAPCAAASTAAAHNFGRRSNTARLVPGSPKPQRPTPPPPMPPTQRPARRPRETPWHTGNRACRRSALAR